MGIAVIVPCDHSFGWEAPVNPPWPGFLLSSWQNVDDWGVVLNSWSAMSAPWWVSLPITVPPKGT